MRKRLLKNVSMNSLIGKTEQVIHENINACFSIKSKDCSR